MRFTSVLLASALLAFTVSSTPLVERTDSNPSMEYCATPEQYSAYGGGEGLSPEQFVANTEFSQTAKQAGNNPPEGYKTKFKNLKGASLVQPGDKYKTTFLSSYDTWKCASLCDAETKFKCEGFNIYYERAPKYKISKSDGSDCPYTSGSPKKRTEEPQPDCCTNPVSITQIKCVILSYVPTKENAVNKGQYQNKFHIVIAGSDGFKKKQVY